MHILKFLIPDWDVTLDIPLSRAEMATIKEASTMPSTLRKVYDQKIIPKVSEYLAITPKTCCICRSNGAIRMNCNIALNIDSMQVFASSPYPICASSTCNSESSRRAHEDRRVLSNEIPETAGMLREIESEMCDNCMKVQKVIEHGHLKRCSRCKAKLYCSRECQVSHWKSVHKYDCNPPSQI